MPVQGQSDITGETRRALQDAFVEEVALRMAAYGFTREMVSALHASGFDVVTALAFHQPEAATLRAASLRAEQVLLVDVMEPQRVEDLDDGAESTVRLRVVETLKGDAPKGRIYELRLPGGAAAALTGPAGLKPRDRLILFAGPARYRHEAGLRGAPLRPQRPFLTFTETEPIRVLGGLLRATHTTPQITLDDFRAELRPLEAARRR